MSFVTYVVFNCLKLPSPPPSLYMFTCSGGEDESPWSLQPKGDERFWGVRAGRGQNDRDGRSSSNPDHEFLISGGQARRAKKSGWRKNNDEQGSEDSGHTSHGVVPSDVFY